MNAPIYGYSLKSVQIFLKLKLLLTLLIIDILPLSWKKYNFECSFGSFVQSLTKFIFLTLNKLL